MDGRKHCLYQNERNHNLTVGLFATPFVAQGLKCDGLGPQDYISTDFGWVQGCESPGTFERPSFKTRRCLQRGQLLQELRATQAAAILGFPQLPLHLNH